MLGEGEVWRWSDSQLGFGGARIVQLFEADAKELASRFGLPVPIGFRCRELEELKVGLARLGGRGVLKAQFPFGGRGRAGFVRSVSDVSELEEAFHEMRARSLRGLTPQEFLLEALHKPVAELYVAETIDVDACRKMLLVSRHGGVDVESSGSGGVLRTSIDPVFGLVGYQARALAGHLGFRDRWDQLLALLRSIDACFDAYQLRLLEINPLALMEDGAFLCLDVRMVVDEGTLPRHADLRQRLLGSEPKLLGDRLRLEYGLEFVELDGNIGLISGGAGMTMAVIDLIAARGGRAACFLDCSANPTREGYGTALRLLNGLRHVTNILVSIIGGATLVDRVAANLVQLIHEIHISKPLTIRLEGANWERAHAILREAGISAHRDLEEAVEEAIRLARGTAGVGA